MATLQLIVAPIAATRCGQFQLCMKNCADFLVGVSFTPKKVSSTPNVGVSLWIFSLKCIDHWILRTRLTDDVRLKRRTFNTLDRLHVSCLLQKATSPRYCWCFQLFTSNWKSNSVVGLLGVLFDPLDYFSLEQSNVDHFRAHSHDFTT